MQTPICMPDQASQQTRERPPPQIPKQIITHTKRLPSKVIPGHVLVNSDGHRLDPYMAVPPTAHWNKFKARTINTKLCVYFHLHQSCKFPKTCPYDHEPIDEDTLYCLKYVMRLSPCNATDACRTLNCAAGHICQKQECIRGKSGSCQFKEGAHQAGKKAYKWVKPKGPSGADEKAKEPMSKSRTLENLPAKTKSLECPVSPDRRSGGRRAEGWNSIQSSRVSMEEWRNSTTDSLIEI